MKSREGGPADVWADSVLNHARQARVCRLSRKALKAIASVLSGPARVTQDEAMAGAWGFGGKL